MFKKESRRVNENFVAPTKNETAMHPWMPAGDNYGVGTAQPIGTIAQSGASAVPHGCKCTDLK